MSALDPNSTLTYHPKGACGRTWSAMESALNHREAWSLLTLVVISLGIIANTFHGDGEPLIASLAFSGLAFAGSYSLIRWLGTTFIKANLKGRDMSKLKKVEM